MLTSNSDPGGDVGKVTTDPKSVCVVATMQNPMLGTLEMQSESPAEDSCQLEVITEPNFVDSSLNISNSRLMSAFLILNSMIGSGIFNQPYVFSRAGLGSAILLITVTAVFVYLGIIALVEASIHTSTDDFSALGRVCLGRFGESAVDVSIIISSVGSIMSYVAVIGHLASTLLASWGWSYAGNDGVYLITSLMIFAFVMPFCAHRYFGHFAFISVLSMGSVCCVILLLVVVGPIITAGTVVTNKFFIQNGALGQLGSIIFALNCAPSVLPTYRYIEKEHQNSEGWRQIAFTSTAAGYIMILVMGLIGYLMFGDETEEIIIMNFRGHYADIFKILLIVHLILYTPLDFLVLRQSVLRVIGVKSGLLLSQKINIITTIVILGGTMLYYCHVFSYFNYMYKIM
jgi:solute carrier family 36 (proton-coupled amino acid transporter)